MLKLMIFCFLLQGGTGTHFSQCTHTIAGRVRPWWRVDLETSQDIATVTLTNRGDCCGNRLSNFEIRIGDTLDDANGGQANPAISGSPFGVSSLLHFLTPMRLVPHS